MDPGKRKIMRKKEKSEMDFLLRRNSQARSSKIKVQYTYVQLPPNTAGNQEC